MAGGPAVGASHLPFELADRPALLPLRLLGRHALGGGLDALPARLGLLPRSELLGVLGHLLLLLLLLLPVLDIELAHLRGNGGHDERVQAEQFDNKHQVKARAAEKTAGIRDCSNTTRALESSACIQFGLVRSRIATLKIRERHTLVHVAGHQKPLRVPVARL